MSANRPRRPCLRCDWLTTTADQICRSCAPLPAAKRPEVACQICGRRTHAKGGICSRCPRDNYPSEIDPEDTLTNGEWVRRGLTWHWQDGPPVLTGLRGAPRHVKPKCGTERAYQWHRRDTGKWPLPADDPCGCKAAHRKHVAERAAMRNRPEMKEAS